MPFEDIQWGNENSTSDIPFGSDSQWGYLESLRENENTDVLNKIDFLTQDPLAGQLAEHETLPVLRTPSAYSNIRDALSSFIPELQSTKFRQGADLARVLGSSELSEQLYDRAGRTEFAELMPLAIAGGTAGANIAYLPHKFARLASGIDPRTTARFLGSSLGSSLAVGQDPIGGLAMDTAMAAIPAVAKPAMKIAKNKFRNLELESLFNVKKADHNAALRMVSLPDNQRTYRSAIREAYDTVGDSIAGKSNKIDIGNFIANEIDREGSKALSLIRKAQSKVPAVPVQLDKLSSIKLASGDTGAKGLAKNITKAFEGERFFSQGIPKPLTEIWEDRYLHNQKIDFRLGENDPTNRMHKAIAQDLDATLHNNLKKALSAAKYAQFLDAEKKLSSLYTLQPLIRSEIAEASRSTTTRVAEAVTAHLPRTAVLGTSGYYALGNPLVGIPVAAATLIAGTNPGRRALGSFGRRAMSFPLPESEQIMKVSPYLRASLMGRSQGAFGESE